jgi:hypothetical protein
MLRVAKRIGWCVFQRDEQDTTWTMDDGIDAGSSITIRQEMRSTRSRCRNNLDNNELCIFQDVD